MKDNLIIEGLPGSGKSTFLQRLRQQVEGYTIVYEGDLSPVDLKWCAYMTELEYKRVRKCYRQLADAFERYSIKEKDHYIVAYTRIITDIPGFHKEMEAYELYDGQCSFDVFKKIICERFEAFNGKNHVFEGSFFHHTLDTLFLYYALSEDRIRLFYDELYAIIENKGMQILYLMTSQVEERVRRISEERVDVNDIALWEPLMLRYLAESPYGKKHCLTTHNDLIEYLEQREAIARHIVNRHKGIVLINMDMNEK